MTAAALADPPRSLQDRLRASLRDRPLLVSVIVVSAVMFVATVVLTPRYETNDDAAMQMIVSGVVFADAPDEHLMYSNVLIGLTLKSLYGKAPDVPWYALYQFATLAVSAAAVCYALLRVSPTVPQTALIGLFLVAAVLPCFVDLQFTKTAFLACFAGLVLLLAPLRGAAPWPRAADVVGCLLIIWGSLIRFESLPLAVIMAFPVAAVAAYGMPYRAAWRAVPLVAVLGLAVALSRFNTRYYARSPGWEGFYAYNDVRGEFTDFDRFKYSPVKGYGFHEAGWQEIDYWMIVNWFFADPTRFSMEKLQQIAAAAPRNQPPAFFATSAAILRNLGYFPDLIRIMLVVICAAFLVGTGWRRLALPASLYALAVGLMLVLGVYYKLPHRVAFPLFLAALVGGALRPEGFDERIRGGHSKDTQSRRAPDVARVLGTREALRRVVAMAAGCLVIWCLWSQVQTKVGEGRLHSEMTSLVEELKPRPDQLFVLWREWFPVEKLVYPLESTRRLRDFRCLWLSAQLPTPLSDRRLRDFGISNIYLAICERPNVFLVAGNELFNLFSTYVRQHYDLVVAPRVEMASPSTLPPFRVYRVFVVGKAH
jgi:hypothetical protein